MSFTVMSLQDVFDVVTIGTLRRGGDATG